ncbi:hypothetical protein C6V82_01925 [Halomonas urumqiensis]|nr:hypothetical protein C6V82_01925 [Halomonas urumqiensis]
MPLFFVHIPKTAGTSFRLGAEKYFSSERIVYDYGKNSDTTSALVKAYLYGDAPDSWQFRQALLAEKADMIGGHVRIGRFVSLLGVGSTITFLREPLQRVASEYAHFVRHNGYKGSFKEFYSDPKMHNRQLKALQGVNTEAIGLIGLTERYPESLEMLNKHFGINIPRREDNQGKPKLNAQHQLDKEDVAALKRLNKRDIALYQHATALFESRYAMFKSDQPWAHARLVEASTKRVSGWAWWAGENNSDEPLDIEVWVNDELAGSVRAVELRPELCRLLPPRGGHVGFHLPVKLSAGDRVQCRVTSTGQRFPPTPRRVVEPAKS